MSSASSNSSNSSSDSESINSNSTNENDEICENFNPLIFFKTPKQLCYFKMINSFFKKCPIEIINKMVDIINLESVISLRVLEWVVTKSGKKTVNIKIRDNDYYSVNIMYKAQLKTYKKKNFDPFRRDRKFFYEYDRSDPSKKVLTTLGQLNFFKWAIQNGILDCVEKNYDEINSSMIKYNKEEKVKKIKKKKKVEIITTKTKQKIDDESLSSKSTSTIVSKSKFILSFD
jgi:hypothetical protein